MGTHFPNCIVLVVIAGKVRSKFLKLQRAQVRTVASIPQVISRTL